MWTGWRAGSILVVICVACGCGQGPGTAGTVAPLPGAGEPASAAVEDALKGYPDAPGSKQALKETLLVQEALAPEARLATVLLYAKEPVGAKLLEAELARLKATPSKVRDTIAAVRAEVPGTPVAAAALAVELDTLRQQEPPRLPLRCQEVFEAPDSSASDKAVALYTRALYYGDAGQAKLGALDALRFWADYPDKVRRMKAAARLASLVREAGFLCEADMLEDSEEPEVLARALHDQFVPLRESFAGNPPSNMPRSPASAYALHAPDLDAVAANTPEGESSPWEKAQFLGRAQRLVAYEGDLDRVVELGQQYIDTVTRGLAENSLPDDTLTLAYAQTRIAAETLRKLLVDPHFVRSATTKFSGSTASMRSEQVLGRLSLLALDLAERRLEKKQIDEVRLARAYTKHADTLKTINDTDNTIQAYQRYVELHPQAADAPGFLKRVAEVYIGLNALGSAADTFKDLYERYPASPEAPAAKASRINCLYQSEAYEQAYEEAAAFCVDNPDDPNAANVLLLRGLSEAAMEMADQAGETMREVVSRFPSSAVAPQALLWQASRALSAHNYAEAKNCFQSLIDRYPNSDGGQRAHEYLERLSKMTVEPRNDN